MQNNGALENNNEEQQVGGASTIIGFSDDAATNPVRTLNPNLCELNVDYNGEAEMLSDEPGMNELMSLYYDSGYDYSTGSFTEMSPQTKKQFQSDLKKFYTAFTGESEMPEYIQKFSDIKLKTYNKTKGCNPNEKFRMGNVSVSATDEHFIQYADNLNLMIHNAISIQKKLLGVINDIFVFVSFPHSPSEIVDAATDIEAPKIRINPNLTNDKLDKLIEVTRNIIIELYVTCESDFTNGIKIYEKIIEKKILETTKQQISVLLEKENDQFKTTNPKTFLQVGQVFENPFAKKADAAAMAPEEDEYVHDDDDNDDDNDDDYDDIENNNINNHVSYQPKMPNYAMSPPPELDFNLPNNNMPPSYNNVNNTNNNNYLNSNNMEKDDNVNRISYENNIPPANSPRVAGNYE